MLTKSMRAVLGQEKDLGNKLHSYYVYHASLKTQLVAKEKFEDLIKNYSDRKFIAIAPTKLTQQYVKDFINLKHELTWEQVTSKFLKGMVYLLDREISKSSKIQKPKNIKKLIANQIKKIPIYHKDDIITITEKKFTVRVDYMSKKYSPEYDGKYDSWRDTQLIFILNFEKNLFIWEYINVHSSLRGKGLGTKLSLFCENIAKDLGFSRFVVSYPNRKYWINKMGYEIPYRYRIGTGNDSDYTHEGYKEI